MTPEAYQIASALIEEHGSHVAWQHAVIRALEQADPDGVEEWARVVEAIDELTRTERRLGETDQ